MEEKDVKNDDETMEEEKESQADSCEEIVQSLKSPRDKPGGVKNPASPSFQGESMEGEDEEMSECDEETGVIDATTKEKTTDASYGKVDEDNNNSMESKEKELFLLHKNKKLIHEIGEEEEESEKPERNQEWVDGKNREEKETAVDSKMTGIMKTENGTLMGEKDEGEDKEEGELEEGELEDEEGEEREEAKGDEETSEREQNKENRDTLKLGKNKDQSRDKNEVKDKKGKDDRKRKHKEFDEEKKKKKKRKHHYSSEEEEAQKKKFPPGREKPYDFDTLLKQEMYLVGSGPNLEGSASPEEEQYRGPLFQGHPQYKGPNDGDSYESASGEEWEEKPRRRMKRKRRGSRSPSRKNEAICMFYLQGSCKRGGECPYSHEIAPTRKMELCKFYMMDCCAKKEKCLYMHKDFPCKYFHFGMKCKAGDLCKFSHDPLRDITRNILLKHIELAPKDILGDFPRVSKLNAQIILGVTEAKRKGEPVDFEGLENVLDLEGKGFKYLDRALKNVRKRKDGDKKGEKEREREKEDKERSPKKNKSREDHRDSDKDREREKDGGLGRERERERPRERDKERDRNRERGRHRSKGEYPSHMSQKQRDFSHRLEPLPQHSAMEEPRNREGHGRPSFDARGSPAGASNHSIDPTTRWYSSDEEGENPQGFRRSQSYGSPQERRNRSGEPSQSTGFQGQGLQQGHSQGFPHASFPSKSNLDDIDVSYLKNVLNAVQSQSSQNSLPPAHGNQRDQDIRANSSGSWSGNMRGIKSPPREGRTASSSYLDMSNDIKEVFYDGLDISDDISRSVDSLIQSARGRTSSEQEFREGRSFRNFRDAYQSQSDPSWSPGPNPRREDTMNSRDFIPQGYRESSDDKNFGRDTRYLRENFNPWKGKRERDPLDSRDDATIDSKYLARGEFEFSEGGRGSKEDTDLRLLHSIAGGRPLSDVMEGPDSKTSNQSPGSAGGGDRAVSSIYDFDLRQLETRKMAHDTVEELGALPFKVPTHSAKEIDASLNSRIPIYYQLIGVDVPKPDFSRLKVNPDDPKTFDDPRLRKMLRRNSTEESPRSPRGVKFDGEGSLGSPIFENKLKFSDGDNRDPRKIASRDIRADFKGLSRMDSRGDLRPDPRVDPRMASRADPRADPRTDPRSDPRMDLRGDPRGMSARFDPRMDNRDPRMDSDMRETDPRIGGPVFVNGMMEGPNYPHFANMGGVSIDPRGRPGLLGPAPGQGPKNLPMGLPGQMPPNLGASPFIIPQGIGGAPGPYMSGDRGDMMGVSGPAFPQGQWSGGRGNINDPRLNRDVDLGSFTPSSAS